MFAASAGRARRGESERTAACGTSQRASCRAAARRLHEIPAEPAPPVRPPSKFRDRRAQARHEVDTVATIFLVKVGSALRGRILDLSPSGCRIRTDERFPVGIYTRVETEFHLEGLPFRLGGVIQAIHNRNMVGIRFLDLSERKRQQVLELIDEMEQMRAALLNAESATPEKPHQAGGTLKKCCRRLAHSLWARRAAGYQTMVTRRSPRTALAI